MKPEVIKQFCVGPNGLRYIRLVSIGWAFLISLVIWIFLMNSSTTVNGRQLSKNANYLINAIIVGGLFIITVIIRLVKIGDLYKGIVFVVQDGVIERNKNGLKRFGFYYSDITQIIRTYRGSFIIYTSGGMQMTIPHFIDNRDEFEVFLRANFPTIEGGPYSFYQKYYVALIYLVMALAMGILMTTNKIVMLICSVLIVALFIADLVNKYKLKKLTGQEVDKKQFVFPVGVIFITLIITILKLIK